MEGEDWLTLCIADLMFCLPCVSDSLVDFMYKRARTAFAGLVSYGVLWFTFWFTFWKRWRDEYLGLRGMHRFSIATGGRGRHIVLGDIVLVHDEAYPRTYWRLKGRLINEHNEQIRAAVVPVASRSGTTTLKDQFNYYICLN